MTTEQRRAADWANPAMLMREREQVNLSITQVASELEITGAEVAAWESGDALPSLADLRRLAQLYLCPVGYFFLQSPPATTSVLDYRGLDAAKELTYESHKTLRRFLRYAEVAGDWMERLGLPKEARIPELPLRDPAEAAEQTVQLLGVTQELRESWDSPDEAFAGWRQAVEQRGVFVFSMTLPFGGVRGASTWPDGGVPAILVNHSDAESATGRIFTLLHEFAHLLVRRAGLVCDFRGQPEVETFANRLAARAIVPFDALRSRLSDLGLNQSKARWTDSELNRIREPFQASRDVVAISLEALRLAEPGYYNSRRTAWDRTRGFGRRRLGAPGSRQTKPQHKYRELGERMSGLVLSAEGSGAVSPLDIADMLDMPLRRLPEFAEVVRAS